MVWTYTDGAWTRLGSFVGTLFFLISLMCYKNRHPLNLILLCLFTLSISYLVGVSCTAYAALGYSVVVVEALAITSLLFVGLTMFVMYSKMDFSFLFSLRRHYKQTSLVRGVKVLHHLELL